LLTRPADDRRRTANDAANFAGTESTMLTALFGKRKIAEEKLANAFIHALFEFTEQGFPLICAEINESPEFVSPPGLEPVNDVTFAKILLAGNLTEMGRALGPGTDKRVQGLCISKFAAAMELDTTTLEGEINAIRSRMERLNFPSKNTVYAMAKALFAEYDLFCFQDVYFREQRAPNPIVLKRLNGLMGYFLWNWTEVASEYRIV
jgi:hypothetical protein